MKNLLFISLLCCTFLVASCKLAKKLPPATSGNVEAGGDPSDELQISQGNYPDTTNSRPTIDYGGISN